MDITIGDFVRRDRAGMLWHYIDSTIAGRAVTRCGRQMREKGARPLLVYAPPPQVGPAADLVARPPESDTCADCMESLARESAGDAP